MALAQSGKLRGQITDQETGEPLIGANIIIVGTSYGAATDISGEYTLLNLDAGVYDVKCSYIGYQAKTITGVRINAGLTIELNFELAVEGVQVGTVEIVAEKPLVNKYNTNVNRITNSDDIEALPVRGVDNILALTPGVTLQNNTIFVRGGRQDEVGFYLEGTNITNPLVGGRQVTLVQDALEEIQVQSGGYTAEFGGANSGIIKQQIKTGTPDWRFSLEYITDNLGFNGSDDRYTGEKTLGAYWFGYNEATFTLSGPLGTPAIKFFGLANYNYMTDQNPQPYSGFDLGTISDPQTGDELNFYYPAGPSLNNSAQNYTGTGSFTFDFNPFIIRLVGTYTMSDFDNPWSATRDLTQINSSLLNSARTERVETSDGAFNLKLTHLISANTFWELNAGYSFGTLDRFDPYLKDNWRGYGDSLANANAGWVWDRSRNAADQYGRFLRPKQYQVLSFIFFPEGDVISGYGKQSNTTLNGSASITSQINKEHNLKAGFEIQMYEIANYAWNNENVMSMAQILYDNEQIGAGNPGYLDPAVLIRRQGINNYGYDVWGEKTNESADQPEWEKSRKPTFIGAYLQDRIEYNDLIINAGLRFDYIDIDNWIPVDIYAPEKTWDKNTGDVNPDGLTQTPSYSSVSPRLGFSFALTDQTVFHAQWGKFVQQSRLRDVYQGINATGRQLRGGLFIPAPVGFDVRPTRTTQYEVGFTQAVGEFASFDITAFYKDIQDQIVYQQVDVNQNSPFGSYSYYTNGDVATTRGVEVSFNMRRVERFKVDANVTFQDAKGTGSFPSSNRGIVGAPLDGVTIFSPQYISPLEFNNAIRSSVNLDYRFGEGDGGPVFQQLGLTFLLTYASGHPYTQGIGGADLEGDARDRQPVQPLNSSTTPSTYQVDLRIDKTFNIADLLNLNIYLYVINLFDATNIENVFLRTGSAYDDGYLSDPDLGGVLANTLGPDYVALYNAINIDYYQQWRAASSPSAVITTNGFFFGTPRQVRLGIRLEL